MDTKLKSDIAESAVVTELLKRGFRVLKPVGDRLPCDLALDLEGRPREVGFGVQLGRSAGDG